jgi:cytochrome c biogenesis protein CcmG, thiol:disulfide interchange protein DsbE
MTPPLPALSRRALLARGAVGASVLAASSLGCATTPAREARGAVHPLTGLLDLAGKPLDPPKILGSVTIVDFWASWCQPCRQAFRYMDQLYRTYKGDGLDMIAVSVDDDPVAARRFWSAARPRFPVAWDGGGEVRERFHVMSLPTTVLFDPDGLIVQRNEGFDLVDHRLLEEQVHRLVRV